MRALAVAAGLSYTLGFWADCTEKKAALDGWAGRVQAWAAGQGADDLPRAGRAAEPRPREAFVFFISGDKVRAPHAAQAFLGRIRSL